MRNHKHSEDPKSFSEQETLFVEQLSKTQEIPKTRFILLVAANTLDATIGKGCKIDIDSIIQMFEKLSAEMDFSFMKLVVQGEDYGRENILKAIKLLTPGSNDIVVFYYSGHGFSYDQDTTKIYPQIDLRPHLASDNINVVNANTENLADLFEIVKARGARLNIVIGDCCNSLIEFKRDFKGGISLRDDKKEIVINRKSCEVLFCDYTASILIASAGKGEYAVSDDELGSLFTYNFSKSLKMLMKQEIDKTAGLPWKKLLEETAYNTHDLSSMYDIGDGVPGNQNAIYNIELRETLY